MKTAEELVDWRRRFLNELTAIDPSADPAALLRRRRRLIAERNGGDAKGAGGNPADRALASSPETSHAAAQSAIRALQTLREKFFQLSDDRLRGLLGQLRNSEAASYQIAEKRLRVVAEHRKTLQAMSRSGDGFEHFFALLAKLLVGDQATAGAAREQVYSALTDKKLLKQTKQYVVMIRERCPSVYDLEREWFQRIENNNASYFLGTSPIRSVKRGVLIVAAVLFFMLMAVIGERDRKARPNRSTPSPTPPRVVPLPHDAGFEYRPPPGPSLVPPPAAAELPPGVAPFPTNRPAGQSVQEMLEQHRKNIQQQQQQERKELLERIEEMQRRPPIQRQRFYPGGY